MSADSADYDAPAGHQNVTFNLTIPRQYTERGGWNRNCECGAPLGDTGHSDEEQASIYEAHIASVTAPGAGGDE